MTSLLPPGALFVGPYNKPLASTGLTLPLAVRKFFLTDGVTAAIVYQDANLVTPFSPTNQVTADASGRFPPIYLNPAVVYRAQLFTAGGIQLEDANPYVVSPFGVLAAVKPASTSRSNTTVLAADPDLALAIPGAGTYQFDALISFATTVAGATPGATFQAAFSGTLASGFVAAFTYVGFVNGGATATMLPINQTVTLNLGNGVAFNTNILYLRGTLTVSTAGNLSISWAQQTSSATATTLVKGCCIVASQIN